MLDINNRGILRFARLTRRYRVTVLTSSKHRSDFQGKATTLHKTTYVDKLLNKFVFYGVLAILLLSVASHGTVQPLWTAFLDCAIFLLGCLWAIEGLISGKIKVSHVAIILPLIGILLLGLVQLLPLHSETDQVLRKTITVDPFQTRLWVLHFGALTLVLAILFAYISTPRRLAHLINVVILIGLASAIFGFFRLLTNFELPLSMDEVTAPGSFGQFVNRNHFALLMEMSLGLAVGLILRRGIQLNQLFIYLIVAALLWVALILSNSRGGLVGMLSQALFIAGTWRGPKHLATDKIYYVRRVVFATVLVVIMLVGVVSIGGDSLLKRWEVLPRELSTEGPSRINGRRIFIWKAGLEMFEANPLAGVGFGAFSVALPMHHDASGTWVPQEAHNDYLELMASGGIIGTLFGLWFICTVGWIARQRLKDSDDPFRRAACLGALTALIGVVVHSFVDFGLHIYVNALVCLALIVIATARISALPLR